MNDASLLDIEQSIQVIEENTNQNDALEKFKELRDRINLEIESLSSTFEEKKIQEDENKAKEEAEALKGTIGKSDCKPPPHPIDVVYTWVNGSDPNFLSVFSKTDLGPETHKDDVKAQRFEGRIFLFAKS